MDRINEFWATKFVVGFASIIFGLPALAFGLFGWYQTTQLAFGIYSMYLCVFGSLGAVLFGSSLALEGFKARKIIN
jgi:hypothetical protein